MTHLHRGTTIDLHHSLAMPTCRVRVDSARMISDAVPVKPDGFWWRLKDEDIVLHAASHLLLNSEFHRGLRDLWDIDLLYRHFAANATDYPERLLCRAREVGTGVHPRAGLVAGLGILQNTTAGTFVAGQDESVFPRAGPCGIDTSPGNPASWAKGCRSGADAARNVFAATGEAIGRAFAAQAVRTILRRRERACLIDQVPFSALIATDLPGVRGE